RAPPSARVSRSSPESWPERIHIRSPPHRAGPANEARPPVDESGSTVRAYWACCSNANRSACRALHKKESAAGGRTRRSWARSPVRSGDTQFAQKYTRGFQYFRNKLGLLLYFLGLHNPKTQLLSPPCGGRAFQGSTRP